MNVFPFVGISIYCQLRGDSDSLTGKVVSQFSVKFRSRWSMKSVRVRVHLLLLHLAWEPFAMRYFFSLMFNVIFTYII